MSGIATCTIAGNLTRDPELNDSGKVLSFGVAVNRREKDASGEYDDKPHFFDVKVLGNRAQALANILAKGRGVTVQGDLTQERWEKDGQKRSAVRIIAREVVLHGSGDGESSGGGSKAPVAQRSGDAKIPF